MAIKDHTYEVSLSAKNEERTLTDIAYPNMDYGEFVALQILFAVHALRAGVAQAEANGFDVTPEIKAMIGL